MDQHIPEGALFVVAAPHRHIGRRKRDQPSIFRCVRQISACFIEADVVVRNGLNIREGKNGKAVEVRSTTPSARLCLVARTAGQRFEILRPTGAGRSASAKA